MATEVIITDDLDGSRDAQPVRFGFHDKAVRDRPLREKPSTAGTAADPLHRQGPGGSPAHCANRQAAAAKRPGRQDLAAIREWAHAKGLEVSDRGRIKAEIIEQYDQEQAAPPARATAQPDRATTGEGVRPVSGSNSTPSTP